MKSGLTLRRARPALPVLRAAAVAAALACGASAGIAADATLSITSFSASAEAFSGFYVWATNPYQSFAMSAANGGGVPVTDSYAANDWYQGANRLAQTSAAKATGNTVQFTDAFTQLGTAGLNLGATATANNAVAKGTGSQSGTFSLIDGNGDAVAGTITFDIYYDLAATPPVGTQAGSYAQSMFTLLTGSTAGSGPSFTDSVLANAQSGAGAMSGHFSWTVSLAAGETASYTLNASAVAAAVPEPGSFALLGLGLAGLTALARRRKVS